MEGIYLLPWEKVNVLVVEDIIKLDTPQCSRMHTVEYVHKRTVKH